MTLSEPCPVGGRTSWAGEGVYRTMPRPTDDDQLSSGMDLEKKERNENGGPVL